jgi:hypothetical protein
VIPVHLVLPAAIAVIVCAGLLIEGLVLKRHKFGRRAISRSIEPLSYWVVSGGYAAIILYCGSVVRDLLFV